MGLFTPVWKERNLEKALAYVDKCNKQSTLTRIANEAYYSEVCIAAINKLTDQDTLYIIAMNRGITGDAALERLEDPRLLLRLAVESQTAEKGKKALEKISDNECLIQAARTAYVSAVREKAASRLTDPAVLKDIARRDKNADVRKAAVEGLDDEEILKVIAREDSSASVRGAALARIREPEARYAIGRQDENELIRAETCSVLGDQASLKDILLNGKTENARRLAAEHLEDQEALERAARSDTSSEIRRLAREKLKDPQVKAELVFREGSEEERLRAINELPLSDQNIRDIVLKEKSETVAMEAVRRITDHRRLMDIALRSQMDSVISFILDRFSEREDLLVLAGRPAAAEMAIAKMRKLDLLDERERKMPELELQEYFFRKGCQRNGKGFVLDAYNDGNFAALAEEPCEESVMAALLLLRKNPTERDSTYSSFLIPSRTAERAAVLLHSLYNKHPELRTMVRNANKYSVKEHMDRGGISCHDDEGPLIFDFK